MARKCKCRYCNKELTTDNAYKVLKNGKSNYYCNQNEYDFIQIEIKDKLRCLDTICTVINSKLVSPLMVKEINILRKLYDFNIIEKTFISEKKSIEWFLNNKAQSNEYANMKYIMSIIKNNINRIYIKNKEELKMIEKLFNNDIQVDASVFDNTDISINNKPIDTNIKNISEWL